MHVFDAENLDIALLNAAAKLSCEVQDISYVVLEQEKNFLGLKKHHIKILAKRKDDALKSDIDFLKQGFYSLQGDMQKANKKIEFLQKEVNFLKKQVNLLESTHTSYKYSKKDELYKDNLIEDKALKQEELSNPIKAMDKKYSDINITANLSSDFDTCFCQSDSKAFKANFQNIDHLRAKEEKIESFKQQATKQEVIKQESKNASYKKVDNAKEVEQVAKISQATKISQIEKTDQIAEIDKIEKQDKLEAIEKDLISKPAFKKDALQKDDEAKDHADKRNIDKSSINKNNIIKQKSLQEDLEEDSLKESLLKEDFLQEGMLKKDLPQEILMQKDSLQKNLAKEKLNIKDTPKNLDTFKQAQKELDIEELNKKELNAKKLDTKELNTKSLESKELKSIEITKACALIENDIKDMFINSPLNLSVIKASVFDENTIFILIDGEDCALLIGEKGYRYKALSYLLFNYVSSNYGYTIRLEIAKFLQNQEEIINSYLKSIIKEVKELGKAQTKILDGILAHIALSKLREEFPSKYVAFRGTPLGDKYIIIDNFN